MDNGLLTTVAFLALNKMAQKLVTSECLVELSEKESGKARVSTEAAGLAVNKKFLGSCHIYTAVPQIN